MKKIEIGDILKFKKIYHSNKYNKLIEDAITNNGLNEVALNRTILTENKNIFNIELPESKRMNQKDSGRCWCFAGLNFLKYDIAKNMNINLKDFNLSAAYLTFYDKLEKMNTVLEEVINLKKIGIEKLNNLKIVEYDEGGHWEFFKELVKKYGVVPENCMIENKVTEKSDMANQLIDSKIKRDVYTILKYKKKNKSKKKLEELTEKIMADNYVFLSKLIGEPPTIIKLEYKTNDNELISKELTPQEFYKEYVKVDLDDYISVGSIDMYNKSYYKRYTRKYGESVFKLSKGSFINLPKLELKKLMIAQLKDNIPVWFASEVSDMFNLNNSILDTRIYDYEKIFNFKQLSIKEGLNFHHYSCSHAMNMVGLYLENNKAVRWKVENSWGNELNNGYLIMNDNYFDKYVMQAIINKKYLNHKQLQVLKQNEIEILPTDPI